ncbi:MAG TPA: cation diffusion facilitator family transporter [Pyrinomonadaceae bacterium]|nr:cation diffusion facilitator family transporter [Pyrinomonadaceae bacterium]
MMDAAQTAAEAKAQSAHAEDARAKHTAAGLSITAAAFLVALKTAAGLLTGSISIWASLLDSAMDIFASTINFLAVRAASRPPDEDHAYGHGKAESLAGLFQALVITVSGAYLIYQAVMRLSAPPVIGHEWVGLTAMLISSLVSIALVARLRRVARKTDSPALRADAVHYASDVYTNAAALLAVAVVALTGWQRADPVLSLAISAYILWSAVGVGHEAIDVLMDRRLPAEVDEQIAAVVASFREEGVMGFHDLRTRRSGALKFIDLHLEVRREQSLEEAHALTVKVLRAIEREIPRSRVQIHTDPADDSAQAAARRRN